jgi:hypothetical protein
LIKKQGKKGIKRKENKKKPHSPEALLLMDCSLSAYFAFMQLQNR